MPTEGAAKPTAREYSEWLRLFANRNEVAEEYATFLRGDGPSWLGWSQLNQAIVERWSVAGLRYIKRRAWKLAANAGRDAS